MKEIEDIREEMNILHNTVSGCVTEGLNAEDEIGRLRGDLDALQVIVCRGFANLQQNL